MDAVMTQAFQEELSCFICLDYFIDPVTLGCGHSFCRPCLCLTWEEAQTSAHCPVCREPAMQTHFQTSIRLKNLVSLARKISLKQLLSSREHECVTHKQPKKIFCEEDNSLLCALCCSSQEHGAHRLCPVEGAAEDYREKFLKQMRSLWEKIQENQRNLNEESRVLKQWVWYMRLQRQITKATYRMLSSFTQKKENKHLMILRIEGTIILQQLKKNKTKMIQKRKRLRTSYKEMMKMCRKPDMELLQDLEDTTGMCESVAQPIPQPLRPRLSAEPIPGLIDSLNSFRVDVCFNNEIKNQNIILLDNVRSLLFGQDHQDASLDSQSSSYFAAWGDQDFSSGTHYWEMTVNHSWDWALGVCEDLGTTKNPTLIEYEKVFLLLCVTKDAHCNLFTTSPIFPHYIEMPMGRIGVFLDFESGSISFLNVDKSSLIWKYPTGSLDFPVRPFIFTSST